MKLSREKLENYEKNLRSLQAVTHKLLSHMKGHDWSFRQEITDEKRRFSQEKLRGLVEELLSGWEDEVRGGTGTDPATGESLAEPYLQARRELYGSYLYLVMRCSLLQGAYAAAYGGDGKERTDFAYLLEQAGRLSRSWCVMAQPDGSKKNELFQGYDRHFGFHLYRVLSTPYDILDHGGSDEEYALTPYWKSPETRLSELTDEGNMKRIFLRRLDSVPPAAAEEEAEDVPEAEPADGELWDDDFDDGGGYEYDPLEYDLTPEEEEALYSAEQQKAEQDSARFWLAMGFEGQEEYLAACERFVSLFEQAGPEILRDFYRELEEIVDLYLARREIAPLTNTDKTLNVYDHFYDGPYRQAKRYARGIQWNNL